MVSNTVTLTYIFNTIGPTIALKLVLMFEIEFVLYLSDQSQLLCLEPPALPLAAYELFNASKSR